MTAEPGSEQPEQTPEAVRNLETVRKKTRATKAAGTPESAAATSSSTEATVAVSNIGDQPTDTDLLGFRPYVEAVADFLTAERTDPPLTLSVEGAWGSGKSSFMMQLAKALEGKGRPCVWFNAWRHDQAEAMWAAFALSFIDQLEGLKKRHVRGWPGLLWDRLQLAVARLRAGSWLRGLAQWAMPVVLFVVVGWLLTRGAVEGGAAWLVPFLGDDAAPWAELAKGGGLLALAPLAVLTWRRIADLAGGPFALELRKHMDRPDYQRRTAFVERFHNDFGRIVEAYADGRTVFVFIDDLDRCEVPRSAELMQALNLMIAESPRLVFILGMDRTKVAAGLAVKYEALLPYVYVEGGRTSAEHDPATGLDFGYDFIEKFVQLPFQVPQPTERQLRAMLRAVDGTGTPDDDAAHSDAARQALVEIRKGDDSAVVRDIVVMVAPALDHNPRRIKQFLNAFRLKAHIAHNTGLFDQPEDDDHDPLTLEQLGKFVAISLRWPRLIAALGDRPELLGRLYEAALKRPHQHDDAGAADGGEEHDAGQGLPPDIAPWAAIPELTALLRFGATGEDADERRFGMGRVDVGRLLVTSPAVVGGGEGASTETVEPGKQSVAERAATNGPERTQAAPDMEGPGSMLA